MGLSEAAYQAGLIKRLKLIFPGCIVLKNDPHLNQGMPDLLILFGCNWAMLEVKPSLRSRVQPNQEYYVDLLNDMSFAAFISPENEEQVLYDLQSALGATR